MRKKIRQILLAILCIMNYMVYGQNTFGVSNFRLLETDLTANTSGTTEKDQNGETSALIKVVTTQTGFTFDGGALGVVKTRQTPGEVWVYIPKGAKKITIKHPQLGVLRDYFFPCSIESGRTYEMVLETGTVQTIVTQKANSQYVVFMVTPTDALVELDNEVLPISDGMAQKFVKLGTYDYRVQAKDYHTSAGKVTIDDVRNKKIVNVKLEPAFGWIEIGKTEDLEGAQVFIDNALAGTAPMKSLNLSSGQHSVRVVKELYHPYSQMVDVRDNETTTITPTLTSDYATVTLNVENDADIYVNQEKKGSGSWTGKLGTGSYVFEAKKEGHRTTMMNKEISASQGKQKIQLETPAPIYGSINVTSEPSMADVFIDGKEVGQTPLYLPECLAGNHQIVIRKKNYDDYTCEIVVNEYNNEKVDIQLKRKRDTLSQEGTLIDVSISCNPPLGTQLYIDGKFYGWREGGRTIQLMIGEHLIMVNHAANPDEDVYQEIVNITEDLLNLEVFLYEKRIVYTYKKLEQDKSSTKNIRAHHETDRQSTRDSWKDVRLTYNMNDVIDAEYVGDFIESYYEKGKPYSYDALLKCYDRIRQKASRSNASIVLINEEKWLSGVKCKMYK